VTQPPNLKKKWIFPLGKKCCHSLSGLDIPRENLALRRTIPLLQQKGSLHGQKERERNKDYYLESLIFPDSP
jgi:hypothetical protein